MPFTSAEAVALLIDSRYQSLEGLRQLVAQLSVSTAGETTLLYSGGLQPSPSGGSIPVGRAGVQSFQAAEVIGRSAADIRLIDQTEAARFLADDAFRSALTDAIRREYSTTPANITFEAFRDRFLYGSSSAGQWIPGYWDIASQNFAASASGEVRVIAPLANTFSVFVQSELPALLNNERVTSIEGIPREVLRSVYNMALAQGGDAGALEAVRSAVAFASANTAACLRIGLTEGRITGISTGDFLARSGMADISIGTGISDIVDVGDGLQRASTSTVQQWMEGAGRIDEGVRSVGLSRSLAVLGVLGDAAVVYSAYEMVQEANAAYARGNEAAGQRVIGQWVARTEAGLLAGFAAGTAAGQFFAGLTTLGPAGQAAWLAITIGAGAIGAHAGEQAVNGLLGINSQTRTQSDLPNVEFSQFMDSVTVYANGVRLTEFSTGGVGADGTVYALGRAWDRRWDAPGANGTTLVIYQNLGEGTNRQEIWTGLPGQSTLIARTDIAPAEDGGASIKNYAGTVLVTERVVTSNEFGGTTTRTYDANRVLHNTVIRTPSAGSVEIVQTDPSDASRVTTTRRDAGERIVEVTEQECLPNGLLVTRSYDPSSGQLTSTTVTQRFDDGSRIEEVSYPDGSSLRSTYDDANQLVSRTGTAGPLQSFGTAIQDINALVGAIRSGQPLPILSSGLRLIDNQVNPVINNTQATNNQPLFQTTAVVSAINSLYSLDRAFSGQGNDLDRVSATANAVYSVGAAAQATGLISRTGAVAGVSNGVGAALPYLNAVIAIKNGDYVGAAVSIVAISFPVVGWIYAAYTLITALGDEPPEAWATGRIRFAGAGNVGGEHDLYYDAASGHVLSARDPAAAGRPTALEADIVGDAFGPQRVSSLLQGNGQAPGSPGYFGGLLGYLDGVIAQAEQASPGVRLGIVPQRLPSISWQEARRSDPGYSIVDVDPLTGEQRHPQLRYNDDFSPYNADPTDSAQRRDLFQRMIDSALERNAIASEWEVRTALLQQNVGDPNAGLTEEERAARRGLAAPASATGQRESGRFRPIALDLDGDGAITTVTNAASSVGFDWDDSGYIKQTGWVGTGEGLLMLDRNLNGTVDSGRELFSNGLVANAARGVRSLAWVDANADGRIDAADPVFNELRVWQDGNSNGVVEAGEASTLADLGISQLDYAQSRFTRSGQMHGMSSPDIEADADGTRVSQVRSGIRVEYSDGNVRLFVTRVADLGGGGMGSFTVGDDGITVPEDGSDGPRSTPDEVAIAISLLLANDQFGGSAGGLTITAVGEAQNGAVRLDVSAGLVYFTPTANFNGPASFAYTVKAPSGDTRDATVQVTVKPVADVAQVAVEIPTRPIYGWDTRQVTVSGGSAQERRMITTIYPAEGEPRYAPFHTVGGQLLTESQSDGGGYDVSGDVVDLGISQEYFQRYFDAAAGQQSGDDRPLPYVVVTLGGQRYQVSASPPIYLHDTVVGSEPANDGRVLATAAEGTGSFRIEIASNPLYGEVSIDSNTGAFAYTGRRPFAQSTFFGSDPFLRNAVTDFHNRYDETLTDVFQVRVVDLSDPTGQTFTTLDVPVTHYGPRPLPDVASGGKPIAIDLNGDGFHFTDVDDSNVFFDVNGDGWRRRMAWTNASDGFIAYDRNGDGKITDFDEISFVRDDAQAQTDLEGLRSFDTDGNGIFTSADAKWSSFGVWQDVNSNGLTETGEFRSLTDMGINAISLTSDGQFQVIDNQTVHGTATATRIDGTSMAIADVTLRYTNETLVPNPGMGQLIAAVASPYSVGQTITGTASADLAFGTSGNDQYRTGDGNDVINDDAGNDNVDLGAGNDLAFTGTDNDFVTAGAGNDSVFTGSGNDIAHGGDGDDVLMMEDGNDIAFGANGNDLLAGGAGNDLLSGDAGNDRLLGEQGWDALFGGAGDDELWGMDGNDQLDGGDGNDLLVGGTGEDALDGGRGNDTYEIDSAQDTVVEAVGEGEDTVRSSVSYTLAETVEHLTLTGTQALSGSGNAQRNVLVGNERDNTLVGWGGHDRLDGGRGRDTLVGGTGDDSYVIDSIGDVVVESADEGNDTMLSRITMVAANHVENLTLTGIDAIDATGNSLNNVLVGNGAANRLNGGGGADRMAGGRGNDTYVVDDSADQVLEFERQGYDTVEARIDGHVLAGHTEALILGTGVMSGTGNGLDNTLTGNAGDNWLDGGSGADLLMGVAGNDTYIVDSAADRVVEAAAEGNDTIVASVDQTLSDHIEALVLTGTAALWGTGNALDNTLTGNAASNRLDGGSGADSMAGGAGDDTYVIDNVGDLVREEAQQGDDAVEVRITGYTLTDNVEALSLGAGAINGTGNALDNTLTGNGAANTLDGATGADLMVGGAGDDRYVVDSTGDRVVERSNEGYDTVEAHVAHYTLGADVEALILAAAAVDGTGNALDNKLTGNLAANRLDGEAGDDVLVGAAGDDIYVVDSAGDRVVEALGEGTDTIVASVDQTLSDQVEALILTGTAALRGTGNSLDNALTGNNGANVLDGGTGSDLMWGGAGDDNYAVDHLGDRVFEMAGEGQDTVVSSLTAYTLTDQVEALVLGAGALHGTGNGLDNTLIGNASGNQLDGASGADSMAGGAGDDTYIVENAGDQVIEQADEGHDSVESRTADYTLTDNVEVLRLGMGGINGTGNALGNALTGNAAANRLDGGAGDDLLVGGSGDDIYVVDRTTDSVIEAAGEGFDTVRASATFGLAANVENLVLTGTEAIDGTGNELDNQVYGNASDNKLLGGAGNDRLHGDAGSDLLDGGAGADVLNGGGGDDKYVIEQIGDDVVEAAGSGFDQVTASIDYTLTADVEMLSLIGSAVIGRGNALDNLLFGNAEHNVLDGSFGADQMAGGAGDDRYAIENAEDRVTEATGGGIDTVYASVSRTLEAEVENLVLTGAAALEGVGNEASNALVGNAAANGLSGGDGADVLAGGGGTDRLDGGAGDDLYLYFQGDGRDTLADAGGTDTLRFGTGMTLDSVAGRTITVEGQSRVFISILNTDGTERQDQGIDHAEGTAIERVEFADGRVTTMGDVMIVTRSSSGSDGDDTLTGDRNDDIVHAGAGDDLVYGRTGNDVLYGQDGADRLFGEGGNDELDGGSGGDELWGGAGHDTLDGGIGRDLLFAGTGDDVLLGGKGNDVLDGGAGNDRLDGHDGANELYAGAGDDWLEGGHDDDLLAAGNGDDVVLGGGGNDLLVGGGGNDQLDGGEGSNFIDAGAGDDRIVVRHGENFVAGGRGNDAITLGSNESLISFDRGDGADIVIGTDDDEGTVSLGGGIRYADLALRRKGDSLVLEMGQGDAMTFQDWYANDDHRSIQTLQMVTVGGDYLASSADRLNNRRVVSFDFKDLVERFDSARAADATIGSWALAGQLDSEFEGSSDDHAIGGDFAYRYATLGTDGSGSYGDMDLEAVRRRLIYFQGDQWARLTSSSSSIDPWTAMQAGVSLTIDQTVGLPSPIVPMEAPSSEQLAIAALGAVPERRPHWLMAAMP